MFGKVNQIITNHIDALERKEARLEQLEYDLLVNGLELNGNTIWLGDKANITFKDLAKQLKEEYEKDNNSNSNSTTTS